MAKDNYNIDEILSEVKKRREESEKTVNEAPVPEAPAEEPVVEEPAVEEPVVEEPVVEEPVVEEPAVEEPVVEEPAVEEPVVEEPTVIGAPVAAAEDEGMTDILAIANGEEAPDSEVPAAPTASQRVKKAKKTNKTLKTVIAILIVLIIGAGITAAAVVNNWLGKISDGGEEIMQSEWTGMKTLSEDFAPIQETEADELASMEDMIRTWYYNGTPCSSTHVLNVMLIGEDTRDEEITEEESRADAAILASINIDTKQIMLTSILRDSWAYWETTPGDETTGKYGKLNESMVGGLKNYFNEVERLYKIKLDGYALVNFASFEKIVDTLGGLTLEITDKEINEINNHPKRYGDVFIEKTFEGDKGTMQLTGQQVLAYCRIRKIDSDNMRAERQKTTLMEIFEETKSSSSVKLLQIVNDLIPYVKTSFSKSDVVKIARYAVSQNWMGFDVKTQNFPQMNVTGGQYKDYKNLWIWKADFPADAYLMQMSIYGKSSITLAHKRVDVKNVTRSGYFKDGAPATHNTYINENYGEVTTLPSEEEEEEEEPAA